MSDTWTTDGRRVAWLDDMTRSLENSSTIDLVTPSVNAAARPFNRRPAADFLRGTWLGHALHPLMTDLALGCWLGAAVLDMTPGRRRASQTLVGAGLLAVPLTAAAGMSEWDTINRKEDRRVAAVHAIGNTVAAVVYTRSWLSRRRGRHGTGVMWGMVGGMLALFTGFLGGHLSFARLVGNGHRGRPATSSSEFRTSPVKEPVPTA